MPQKKRAETVNRRQFLKTTSSATTLVAAAGSAPALLGSRSPNSQLGLAQIGVGVRGYQLMAEVLSQPRVKYVAVCDLYDGFLQRGIQRAGNSVEATKDYQKVLANPDVDAVIIATPDHWHANMALDAASAGKHIYLEKPFTNTLDEARRVVQAVRDSGVVFQLGHQIRGYPTVRKAAEWVARGKLGPIVHVRAQHYRNSVLPYLRWYGTYDNFEMPSDADLDHIDWDRFQANVRKHPFHPFRFFHWRCYWDYTNGVAGDLMSHAMDQINAILGMGIPDTCIATGGVYYWRDGRETPDTWNAVFDYPERGLSINYSSLAMSDHYGTGVQIMGKDAALDVGYQELKLYAERHSTRYQEEVAALQKQSQRPSWNFREDPIETYRPDTERQDPSHVGDWLRGIREGKRTRGNIDTAWDEIVTVLMSVESFRQRRLVSWDRDRERIV